MAQTRRDPSVRNDANTPAADRRFVWGAFAIALVLVVAAGALALHRLNEARAPHDRLDVVAGLAVSILLAGFGVRLVQREARLARSWAAAAEDGAASARRSEARFRAALDAMQDPFCIARPVRDAIGAPIEFEIVEANEAGAELAGLPRASLVGARFASVIPGEGAAAISSICRQVIATGVPHIGEYHFEPPLRGAEWLRMQIVPTEEGVTVACQDISVSKRAEAALAALALRDELTALLNRRGFRQLAEQELRVARRTNRSDAVLSLDLNGFKAINDAYGHAEGDAALREVARILRYTLREVDIVARFGGDEFVVYAPDAGVAGHAEQLAARITSAFAAANADATAAGRPYALASGIGVATVEPGDSLDSVLARADAALYARKGRRTGSLPVTPTYPPAA
jgi:diguanylate cyclase (GGDEF)-like protein/PAS domain S-box-containing protein